MSCYHKFIDDLMLTRLNFAPETLMVGTFNPGWDSLNNFAEWFYGRTRNNYFWDVLPKVYGEPSLRQSTVTEWKAFCARRNIALTDLIASIEDADASNTDHTDTLKSYRDDLIATRFKHFRFTDIRGLLTRYPSVKNVYLTRRTGDAFWRQRWQPIEQYCRNEGLHCNTLLTPSGGARFGMPKNVNISLGQFILEQWRNDWHSLE